MKYIFAFYTLLLTIAAQAQNSQQQQRLTSAAQHFIQVYNTGDTLEYQHFLKPLATDNAQLANLLVRYKNTFNMINKVQVRKITALTPQKVEVIAQDNRYDFGWKFTITTDSLQQFKSRTVEPIGFAPDFMQEGSLTTAQVTAAVDAYINNKLGNDFAGNVFIAHNNSVLYNKSFGNNNSGQPNTANEQIGLASMGKMFTAISVLQLKDKGLLSLDDRVQKFLPDLKNKAIAAITIRQLLTHTSGMGDFFQSPIYEKIKDSIKTSADMLPVIEADKLQFEPGKGWAYSNSGFTLLGIIVEKLTGTTFEKYVAQNIFKPAGMVQSVSGDGAGGGLSTINDLRLFAGAIMNHQLLGKASTEELLTYTVNDKYGMGTEHQQLGSEHIVGHSGGFIKVCTEFNMYTKSKYLVIILSNSNPPYGHFLSSKIKELLVRK